MSYAAKTGRPGLFSTGEAAKVAGINLRTAQYWSTVGLATASIESTGIGSDRWYSFADLLVLAAMAMLQRETNIATRRLVAQEIRSSKPSDKIIRIKIGACSELWCDLSALRKRVRDAADALRCSSPKGKLGCETPGKET